MAWWDLGAAVVVASALLVLPGLPAAALAGLRGLWLLGAAIPLSVTVVATAAVVAPRLGLTWSLVPVVLVAIALAAVVLLARRLLGRHWSVEPTWDRAAERSGLLAVGLAAVVLLARLVHGLGDPSDVSQTFDAVFHLNGVQWILDTGDASPASLVTMTTGSGGFYPAGFHAVASLTAQLSTTQLSTAGVVVAVNATWLVLAGLVWPVAIVLLTRALLGTSRSALIGAGVLAAALPAFPLLLVDYGVLYPLLGAYAALTAVLAFSARALGLAVEPGLRRSPSVPLMGLVALMLIGVALMHPSAFVAWMALATPWVVIALVRLARGAAHPGMRVLWSLGVPVWFGALYVASQVLRPGGATWPPYTTIAGAVGDLLTLSLRLALDGPAVPVLVVTLVWIGGVVAAGRRGVALDERIALLGLPLVAGLLYVVAAGFGLPWVRDTFTATWYSNPPRLSALVPIAVIPLGALGIQALWRLLRTWRPAAPLTSTPRRTAVVTAVAVVLATVGVQASAALSQAYAQIDYIYTADREAPLLSGDEERLLERLEETVPADAVIAGNPWTGTSFAYAVADREVLYPHLFFRLSPDRALVTEELRDAEAGDEVCAATERLGVEYVLDFGRQELFGERHPMPGLERLEGSDAVDLVDEEGRARLYRVTACD